MSSRFEPKRKVLCIFPCHLSPSGSGTHRRQTVVNHLAPSSLHILLYLQTYTTKLKDLWSETDGEGWVSDLCTCGLHHRRVTQHWIHQDGTNKKAICHFGSAFVSLLQETCGGLSRGSSSSVSLTQLLPPSRTFHSIYSRLINVLPVNSLMVDLATPPTDTLSQRKYTLSIRRCKYWLVHRAPQTPLPPPPPPSLSLQWKKNKKIPRPCVTDQMEIMELKWNGALR